MTNLQLQWLEPALALKLAGAVNQPAAHLHRYPQPRLPLLIIKICQIALGNPDDHRAIQLEPDVTLHTDLRHSSFDTTEAGVRQIEIRCGPQLPFSFPPYPSFLLSRHRLLLRQTVHATDVGRDHHLQSQPLFEQVSCQALPLRVVHMRKFPTITVFAFAIIDEMEHLLLGQKLATGSGCFCPKRLTGKTFARYLRSIDTQHPNAPAVLQTQRIPVYYVPQTYGFIHARRKTTCLNKTPPERHPNKNAESKCFRRFWKVFSRQ